MVYKKRYRILEELRVAVREAILNLNFILLVKQQTLFWNDVTSFNFDIEYLLAGE